MRYCIYEVYIERVHQVKEVSLRNIAGVLTPLPPRDGSSLFVIRLQSNLSLFFFHGHASWCTLHADVCRHRFCSPSYSFFSLGSSLRLPQLLMLLRLFFFLSVCRENTKKKRDALRIRTREDVRASRRSIPAVFVSFIFFFVMRDTHRSVTLAPSWVRKKAAYSFVGASLTSYQYFFIRSLLAVSSWGDKNYRGITSPTMFQLTQGMFVFLVRFVTVRRL